MEELFRDYWWLLFPLSWMVYAGWTGFLHERRRAEAFKLIRTYREKGQEPPAELARMALGREC
ncbi:MAG: hypothetical protein K1X35_00440 [Caulobacteraceae bacterium]|nr:hypothetical protein [Caulobacteraceae bacterium]